MSNTVTATLIEANRKAFDGKEYLSEYEIHLGPNRRAVIDANDAEDRQAAERIVMCWNRYDQLFEALQAVYKDIELNNVKGGSDELNLLVQQALNI